VLTLEASIEAKIYLVGSVCLWSKVNIIYGQQQLNTDQWCCHLAALKFVEPENKIPHNAIYSQTCIKRPPLGQKKVAL